MNRAQLTEATEKYLVDGYCVVKVAKLEQGIEGLREAFDRLIYHAESLGACGLAATRHSTHQQIVGFGWSWGCDHVFMPELREQSLLDIASFDPIPDLVHSIVGQRVRFSAGHAHWTPANYDYKLHWHRDTRRIHWRKGNKDRRAHVQVCVALSDESAVSLVPGSHVQDLTSQQLDWFEAHPFGVHAKQTTPKVPTGSALLLNTFALHRAECVQGQRRRSIHFGFSRVGTPCETERPPKIHEWMAHPKFQSSQKQFLRESIQEEGDFCEAMRSKDDVSSR